MLKVKFYYPNRITEVKEFKDRPAVDAYYKKSGATLLEVLKDPMVVPPPIYQQLTPTQGVEIQQIKGQ